MNITNTTFTDARKALGTLISALFLTVALISHCYSQGTPPQVPSDNLPATGVQIEVDIINIEIDDIFGNGPDFSTGSYPGNRDNGSNPGNRGRKRNDGAATTQEQVSVLDEELDVAMGKYDDVILQERSVVLGRGSKQGAEEQLEDFEEGELYDDVFDDGDPEGDPGGIENGEQRSQGGTENVFGPPGASVPNNNRRQPAESFPPPDDIPSGNNDDVVARQIREAAMYEEDPELREKLWDEYRKYKNQAK